MEQKNNLGKLTKKDFQSKQDIRWCPGCGSYGILASLQNLFVKLNIPKENIVFVSGIGCSSRLPYYINTYGFHSIHGRATTIASGLKMARPDLSVWIITGDGDGLSIGLHHLVHLMRRNINVNILLFNNRIYGLTKGQYSPTSKIGKITKSSPYGSIDRPINPVKLALSVDCTFIARSISNDLKNLSSTLEAAYKHKGTSFVEILQNCKVFNEGDFSAFDSKEYLHENTVFLEHDNPLVFGKNKDKFLSFKDNLIEITDNNSKNSKPIIYNAREDVPNISNLIANLDNEKFPIPLGIFREVERELYSELMENRDFKNKKNVENEKNFANLNEDFYKLEKERIESIFKKGAVWNV